MDPTNEGRDAGDDMRKMGDRPEDESAHRMAQEANDDMRKRSNVAAPAEPEEMPPMDDIYRGHT